MRLRLATRGSELALWQARHVARAVEAAHRDVRVHVHVVTASGDLHANLPLSQIGGTGIFTREVDRAVLEGEAEIAVHSLKDVPTELATGLELVAVLQREDPRDAFLAAPDVPRTLTELPHGAAVGTSSLRRRALLYARRPDLQVREFRGNLDSRVRKVLRGEVHGAVLALAGLKRLGLEQHVAEVLDPPAWLPAAGQGALAVVARATDRGTRELAAVLDHRLTAAEVAAERAFLHALRGGCQVPVGALATASGGRLLLRVLVAAPNGEPLLRGEAEGDLDEAAAIGEHLAARLLERGASSILERTRAAASSETAIPPSPP